MSHALLLRLAESPYWSLHSALHYLSFYHEHIGISHYITCRLAEFSGEELRDVWGFICHLLVTRPSSSAALESFVVEQAQLSTHIALMAQTLWFMQGHLKDLSESDREAYPFVICERVISKVHDIIYDESSLGLPGSNSGSKLPAHLNASLIGLGTVAAAIGLPLLGPASSSTVIKQAQLGAGGMRARISRNRSDLVDVSEPHPTRGCAEVVDSLRESPSESDQEENDTYDVTAAADRTKPVTKNSNLPRDFPSPPLGKLTRQQPLATRTNPSLPLSFANSGHGSRSLDFRIADERARSPHMSSPSLPLSQNTFSGLDNETLDYSAQTILLRKHYLQNEVNFMLTLESISDKLVLIPKPARVSALRAQLTALNHRLPGEFCIPLWCRSMDYSQSGNNLREPHHRIVRIPAGECVALNSAERAPYLLVIEYLERDLDFLPSRRSNREIILKASRKRNSSLISVESTPRLDQSKSSDSTPSVHGSNQNQVPTPGLDTGATDDEVDIVEQIYGSAKLSSIDDGPVLENAAPLTPRNIDLDNVAWSSRSHLPRSRHPAHLTVTEPAQNHIKRVQVATAAKSRHGDLASLTLEQYADRMNAAAAMLAQLNASLSVNNKGVSARSGRWLWGSNLGGSNEEAREKSSPEPTYANASQSGLPVAETESIRDKIMQEMDALEEERMRRMRIGETELSTQLTSLTGGPGVQDDDKIRQELRREDPSAAIFSESWAAKKSRIRASSPYGHLANWDCASVIVKTGSDLRQEQLAVHLVKEFARIWKEEACQCFVRPFHVLITGPNSGLVETIVDSVSVHSIKKAMYARRLSAGGIIHPTLLDHFTMTYGETHTAKFQHAQRNFALSLAGYSLLTYFLQVKDRHNGNILLHRDGHLIHIDFGFMLSNSPGNLGFEAAPFKLPMEYVELLGGIEGSSFQLFQSAFRQGFLAARKHSQRIITLVELMQKDSSLPCFEAFGEQTAPLLRSRFQPQTSAITSHIDTLIISSLGSAWTRLYDSYQYYTQNIF